MEFGEGSSSRARWHEMRRKPLGLELEVVNGRGLLAGAARPPRDVFRVAASSFGPARGPLTVWPFGLALGLCK